MRRSFLFLQGPCTPFFKKLADQLISEGHVVHKIHFCMGDVVYWNEQPASHFRSKVEKFASFLNEKYRLFGVTDQVLFGDRRPLHRIAIEHGKTYGVRTHVFEEGYFRPSWVTLERGGVNGHSLLPREPNWFLEVGSQIAEEQKVTGFKSRFRVRVVHDVVYHLAGILNPLLYPYYKTHAPTIAPLEYIGYIRRFSLLFMIKKREHIEMNKFIASGHSYFILPLQLNSDAQIRDHSSFSNMIEVIQYVAESFSRYAPADCHLVIKNHPLDAGFMQYTKIIREVELGYGLEGRIHFFETADLVSLTKSARGMLTVNSTSGIIALENGIPTITLSNPIYNLPGLTSQATLDEFWNEHLPPDAKLFKNFRRVVINTTQVNGGFYCNKSIKLAVETASHILTSDKSPLEKLL